MNKQVNPIYKLFQTSNNDFYMFDTYANKIKKVSRNCYEYLRKLEEGKADFFQEAAIIEDEEFKKFLPEEIKKDGITVSHQIYGNIDELLRRYNVCTIKEYVEQRLEMYKRSARLII